MSELLGTSIISQLSCGLAACLVLGLIAWALRQHNYNRQLTAALNNMSQGLCMFDGSARLTVGNKRYFEIYGLSPDQAKPGTSFRDLITQRIAAGTFTGDIEAYLKATMNEIAQGKPVNKIIEMKNGRVIALANRPMRGGGWVCTHDDITNQRAAEQKNSSLAGQEQRRAEIEAAIRTFRERVEAVLGTVADSAGTMRATATTLSGASDQASQRAEGAV